MDPMLGRYLARGGLLLEIYFRDTFLLCSKFYFVLDQRGNDIGNIFSSFIFILSQHFAAKCSGLSPFTACYACSLGLSSN